MLFKRQTTVARSALFAAEELAGALPDPIAEASRDNSAPVEPTEQQLEIARLQAEMEGIQRELDSLRSKFETAVGEAEQRALRLAAEQHIADDVTRTEELKESLAAARSNFEAVLCSAIMPTAAAIAAEMLERLVKPLVSEHDWLKRSITRRLEDLRANAVVKLAVPPGCLEGGQSAEFAATLPGGTLLEVDSALSANTARIVLQLGQIDVDPALGLTKALSCIGEVDAEC
jgi:hypothetical protein